MNSIAPNLKYINQIQQQQKIIEHLKEQYKQKTGFEIPLHQYQGMSESKSNHQIHKSLLIPTFALNQS